jgi:hypothetical protein
VTSQGSPYTRFKRALHTGNLHIVRAAAAELPRIDLADALQIVWLMRDDEALYERAAMRWLGRFALEAPGATLADIEKAAKALRSVWWKPQETMRVLADICAGNGIAGVDLRTT